MADSETALHQELVALEAPPRRAQVARIGERVYIDLGGPAPLSMSVDRALELAKDIAAVAEEGLRAESCPCGSGLGYGACCMGGGL